MRAASRSEGSMASDSQEGSSSPWHPGLPWGLWRVLAQTTTYFNLSATAQQVENGEQQRTLQTLCFLLSDRRAGRSASGSASQEQPLLAGSGQSTPSGQASSCMESLRCEVTLSLRDKYPHGPKKETTAFPHSKFTHNQ